MDDERDEQIQHCFGRRADDSRGVPDLDPIDYARHLLRLRRRRKAALPGIEFGEPAWDLLLDLLVQEAEGRNVSISSASVASGVPSTTALRYISRMVTAGQMVRQDDEQDARRAYVRLAVSTRARLYALLEAELEALGQR